MDDQPEVADPKAPDPHVANYRRYDILDQLSIIMAQGQMVTRYDRQGRAFTGEALHARIAAIDAAVMRIAHLLREP